MASQYYKLYQVAEKIPHGSYTTKDLMFLLDKQYRKGKPQEVWYPYVNRLIDALVSEEFIECDNSREDCFIRPESGFMTYQVIDVLPEDFINMLDG